MQEISNKAQQALGLILVSEASMAKIKNNNKTSKKDPKAQFAPVTFSEEGGVRFLHFGTWWVQGAMRINKPDFIELEYAQQMMGRVVVS